MSRQRRAIYKSCQLCIVYDDPIRSSRSVSGLFSDTVLVTPSDERSSSDRHRIGPSVGSDNWVSKATRQCSARVIAIPPPSLPPPARHRPRRTPTTTNVVWTSGPSLRAPSPDNKSGRSVGNWVHSPRSNPILSAACPSVHPFAA